MTIQLRFRLAILSVLISALCFGVHLYTGTMFLLVLTWVFILISYGITFGLDMYNSWGEDD